MLNGSGCRRHYWNEEEEEEDKESSKRINSTPSEAGEWRGREDARWQKDQHFLLYRIDPADPHFILIQQIGDGRPVEFARTGMLSTRDSSDKLRWETSVRIR